MKSDLYVLKYLLFWFYAGTAIFTWCGRYMVEPSFKKYIKVKENETKHEYAEEQADGSLCKKTYVFPLTHLDFTFTSNYIDSSSL